MFVNILLDICQKLAVWPSITLHMTFVTFILKESNLFKPKRHRQNVVEFAFERLLQQTPVGQEYPMFYGILKL